jgi:hypothetical protein
MPSEGGGRIIRRATFAAGLAARPPALLHLRLDNNGSAELSPRQRTSSWRIGDDAPARTGTPYDRKHEISGLVINRSTPLCPTSQFVCLVWVEFRHQR